MVVIRDEKRIARLKKISVWISLIGFLCLVGGLLLVFMPNIEDLIFYQLLALGTGWILSQIGTYLAHRYLRKPRPDEVLDETLKKVARKGRLYHYVLPAPHVLLTPEGIMVFNAKYQSGDISVRQTEKGDKWKQSGVGLRKWFGQEALGDPTRETENMIKAVAKFISQNAPEVEEAPMGAMVVFTTKEVKGLDTKESSFPAMHYTKVRGYLKQHKRESVMPRQDYEAIRDIFDRAAEGIPEGQPA